MGHNPPTPTWVQGFLAVVLIPHVPYVIGPSVYVLFVCFVCLFVGQLIFFLVGGKGGMRCAP